MKYDIFISYSRKDIEFAREVCAVLDSYKQHYTFEYFFDQSEIQGRDEYLKRISYAINDSKVMLFLASKNSYDSEFCAKELLFADKRGRHIHQYCIDDSEMPLEIDMLLGNHQYRELKSTPIDSMVREVLADALDCKVLSLAELGDNSNADCKSDKQDVKLTVTPTNLLKYAKRKKTLSIDAKVSKAYRVGDYYDDGKKQGVVFEVSEDGHHGKIVGLNQTHFQWQWSLQDKKSYQTKVNVNSDGSRVGIDVIIQSNDIANYLVKWCKDQGEDWQMPSREELLLLFDEKYLINDTLAKKRQQVIVDKHWMSVEDNQFYACDMRENNRELSIAPKSFDIYVRAVAKF